MGAFRGQFSAQQWPAKLAQKRLVEGIHALVGHVVFDLDFLGTMNILSV